MNFRPAVLGLVGITLASTAAVSCNRAPASPAAASPATDDGTLRLRVTEAFVFTPDRLECRAGQRVRLVVTNAIPRSGPDITHNVVVLQPGTDVDAFGQAVVDASPETNYVPPAFSARVVVASRLLRPSAQEELVFEAPPTPGDYPIVCAFPGHCILGMRAVLTVR